MQPRPFVSFLMLYYKELRRFYKVIIQTVLTPLVTSALYLLIFGVSLGSNIQLKSGISYLAFVIPGLVMMGILNNAYQNSSSSIISGKFSGDLQDLKVTPLNNHQIIWAMAFGGLTRGLLVGSITFLVGQIFFYIHFSNWMPIANPIEFVSFCILGGLIFGMLGISVAFWAKTFDQMSSVSSFVLTPLIYLGGVFFSLEILHPFWQGVSKYNPLLYIINGFRYGLLGLTDVSLGMAYGISFVSLLLVYAIAWRSLQKAVFTRW